jgi:hypothetical protein
MFDKLPHIRIIDLLYFTTGLFLGLFLHGLIYAHQEAQPYEITAKIDFDKPRKMTQPIPRITKPRKRISTRKPRINKPIPSMSEMRLKL